MRMEKVTCRLGSDTPSCAVSGRVSKVQMYWGLDATIAHTRPHNNCHQRLCSESASGARVWAPKFWVLMLQLRTKRCHEMTQAASLSGGATRRSWTTRSVH